MRLLLEMAPTSIWSEKLLSRVLSCLFVGFLIADAPKNNFCQLSTPSFAVFANAFGNPWCWIGKNRLRDSGGCLQASATKESSDSSWVFCLFPDCWSSDLLANCKIGGWQLITLSNQFGAISVRDFDSSTDRHLWMSRGLRKEDR